MTEELSQKEQLRNRIESLYRNGIEINEIAMKLGEPESKIAAVCETFVLTHEEMQARKALTLQYMGNERNSLLADRKKRLDKKRDALSKIDDKALSIVTSAVAKAQAFLDQSEMPNDAKEAINLLAVANNVLTIYDKLTKSVDDGLSDTFNKLADSIKVEVELLSKNENEDPDIIEIDAEGKRKTPAVTEKSDRRTLNIGVKPI